MIDCRSMLACFRNSGDFVVDGSSMSKGISTFSQKTSIRTDKSIPFTYSSSGIPAIKEFQHCKRLNLLAAPATSRHRPAAF